MSQENKFGWGILIFIFFIIGFYLVLNSWESHYADKGYRLCINLIDENNERGYRDTEAIASCIEKYAEVKIDEI